MNADWILGPCGKQTGTPEEPLQGLEAILGAHWNKYWNLLNMFFKNFLYLQTFYLSTNNYILLQDHVLVFLIDIIKSNPVSMFCQGSFSGKFLIPTSCYLQQILVFWSHVHSLELKINWIKMKMCPFNEGAYGDPSCDGWLAKYPFLGAE